MIRAPKHKALRETALIGHALNPDPSVPVAEATRDAYAALSTEDWHRLFNLADRRMVLPGWFLGLRDQNILPFMPALLRDAAEAAWLLNVERNKTLVREALSLSSLLAEIECRTVYLKGMGHILTGAHGDIGARMTGDLDVLVPRNRVQDAARHLQKHGGQFHGGIPFDVGIEPTRMSHHLPLMQMKEGIGGIELHSDFVMRRAIWPSADDILKEALVPGQDASVFVPRPDHSIALSIAHSLSRSVALPGAEIHLKDLWDVTILSRAPSINTGALRQSLLSTGQESAFDVIFGCAQTLFGVDPESGPHLKSRVLTRIAISQMAFRSKGPVDDASYTSVFDRNYRRLFMLAKHGGYRAHLLGLVVDPAYRAAWRVRRAANKK